MTGRYGIDIARYVTFLYRIGGSGRTVADPRIPGKCPVIRGTCPPILSAVSSRVGRQTLGPAGSANLDPSPASLATSCPPRSRRMP